MDDVYVERIRTVVNAIGENLRNWNQGSYGVEATVVYKWDLKKYVSTDSDDETYTWKTTGLERCFAGFALTTIPHRFPLNVLHEQAESWIQEDRDAGKLLGLNETQQEVLFHWYPSSLSTIDEQFEQLKEKVTEVTGVTLQETDVNDGT